MPLTQTAPPPPAPQLRVPYVGVLLRCLLVGLVAVGLLEAFHVIAGRNTHEVAPGWLYRCAQPSPDHLEALIARYGIRTVVNLRGTCDKAPWFLDEARVTRDREINQWDLAFSAGRLPPVPEVRRLVEVIDHAEQPILFHCNRGIDRTGMTICIALLLHSNTNPSAVRRHLSLRHGHLAAGKTANMDRFLDLYEEWLAATATEHSQAAFRQWVVHEYCPGACRCQFELLEPDALRRVPAGEPVGVRVRCINTSVKPWRMTPSPNAGIHCTGLVFNADDAVIGAGKAGLFYATIEPGASVDLTIPLAPFHAKGRYTLRIDLHEGQHGYFFQVGGRPLFCELEVL